MQWWRLWWSMALLFLLASGFLVMIPGRHVLAQVAHSTLYLASPTPTPDANTTLQMAQQEETNIQTILSIINVLVVVYPILITLAAVLVGFFGFRGFRALEKQGQDLLEDIKKLQGEAAEKKATVERTQEALVYLALGDRLSNQNETRKAIEAYEKATEHLRRAVALRPNYDDALSTLGGLYRRKGEYEKALEYYESAYRADPTSSYALGNVASLSWYLGKLDKARKYYMLTEMVSSERAMATHAEVYWDYYDLALAQLILEKTEDAKKSHRGDARCGVVR